MKIFSFIHKEFLHILRDKRTMLILIAMPIVQIILFGFAISTEVNNIRFSVLTPTYSEDVTRLVNKIDANEYFTFTGYLDTTDDITDALQKGNTDIIVHLDKDFSQRANQNTPIQIVVDASDPNTSTMESMYLKSIINDYLSIGSSTVGINQTLRLLYNPQMKSAYNFVPGIMGLILMLICAMMTSISIVKEKEIGTMEVLLVSPTQPIMVIAAKMVPYFAVSCANLITIILLSVFLLDIPLTGSVFWLGVLSFEYIILALAFGLFISTIMKTQVSAMLASVMIILFPTILLSGMMYPIENLPLPLQWISAIIPARWFISGVRKLMIQGVGVEYVWREMVILFGITMVVLTVSIKKFKNRLD